MRAYHFLALITLLSASCSFHNLSWNESPGRTTSTFTNLRGKNPRTVTLNKGEYLWVSYSFDIRAGALTLSVDGSGRTLWTKRLAAEGDTSEFYVVAPETGKYNITVTGAHASGSFDIHYHVSEPKKIAVKTNTNIELFGLILDLDNGKEIIENKDTALLGGRRTVWAEWNAAVVRNYRRYKDYESCAVLRLYQNMQAHQYYNDFFIGFLLQVDEAPAAKINENTDRGMIMAFSPKGDSAEAWTNANNFLALFNGLYRDVQFDRFLAEYKDHYTEAHAEVARNLPADNFIPILENFYRQQFNTYCLVPSLTIVSGMGFGKTIWRTRTIYNVFAPMNFQNFDSRTLDMGFNFPDKIRGLTVHEFGHSFVNSAIDALPQDLVTSTEHLFTPLKERMKKNGYTAWMQCLYESFVRAGEVLVAEKLGDTTAARTILTDNMNTGFIYVPFIVEELRKYDKDKSITYRDAVLSTMKKMKETYK